MGNEWRAVGSVGGCAGVCGLLGVVVKQKRAYWIDVCDWSLVVFSSDLLVTGGVIRAGGEERLEERGWRREAGGERLEERGWRREAGGERLATRGWRRAAGAERREERGWRRDASTEEHTSQLKFLTTSSDAVHFVIKHRRPERITI